jgi:hypothetical protein
MKLLADIADVIFRAKKNYTINAVFAEILKQF